MNLLVLFNVLAVLTAYTRSQSTECPEVFKRYSAFHTYCRPNNPNCNILSTLITKDDIGIILREHNAYRNKIAIGGEKNLPPAANMLEMVWDNELAAVAQKHANLCLFEHDCSNCRRVQNFGVGQNLAIEVVTNSPSVPQPNWPSAIKSWYDEINYFSKGFIDPFIAPPPEPTYGHFTQLVWAESWRIGCGYALYQEGNSYKKLYTCNYGPAGNIMENSMYKKGATCSACPQNSCCGNTCQTRENPGLCKITDNKAPVYKPQENYMFYCDFQNQPDCNFYITGTNNWLKYNTLSGNYLGIVLRGGEESTLVFNTKIKPQTDAFCFVTNYRKGPNVAGQEEANKVVEMFVIDNYEQPINLPSFAGDSQQQFSKFSMSLSWKFETEVKVTFSVPPGKPEQFLEIQSVYATDGICRN